MKKLALLFMVLTLLLPTGITFAQSGDGFGDPCDPAVAFNDLFLMITSAQDIEDVLGAATMTAMTASQCAEVWIDLAMEALLSLVMPIAAPDFGATVPPVEVEPPPVSSVTPLEVESAMRAALAGDIETFNAYVCEAEQLTPDGGGFSDVTINSLICRRGTVDTETITCSIDVSFTETSSGEFIVLEQEIVYEIVDGELCNSVTTDLPE